MGRLQLQAAMSLLSMDDKESLDPALSSLARCHNMFLSSGDEDGFRWSVHLLHGIICRAPYKLKSQSELFSILVSCFDKELAAESPVALAAFHVGRSAIMEGQERNRWFSECLEHVKTRQLKYEATTCLGIAYLQGSAESLQWFQEARELSSDKTVTQYRVAKALAVAGRHEEASASLASLEDITDSSFRLALAAMLEAVILRGRTGSGSISTDDVIRAYSKARTMLLPLMANWESKLHDYLGCTAPFMPLLIRFLKVDNFGKYLLFMDYQSNLEGFQGPVPENLEHCFFVLELYKDSRNEMVCIQKNGPVESFMDPRPHLEQGIEILYFSKEPSTALNPLVLGQQVAIKAGHATGFSLASTYIEHYIASMEQELDILSHVMTAFQNNGGHDGEDAEAWAAYYVGTSDVNDGKVSEAHYKCLELAFEKSRTPFLGFHISTALGHATTVLNMKLHYFETVRTHALVLGREEFVLSALYELFIVSLHEVRVFDRAFEVQKEAQCSSFPDSMLCQGVSAFMEGSIDVALQSHGCHLAAMRKAVDCLEHLPRYDPVKIIPTYFADKDGDVWSSKKNLFAQMVYGNALGFVRESRQVPYKVSDEYDAVQTTVAQLHNMCSAAASLLEAGSLEQAEEEAANALRILELWTARLGPQILLPTSSILMTLAGLVCAHYQRQPDNFPTKESAVQMISQFANEAVEVARLADETLPTNASSLKRNVHGILLLKLGENSDAITVLEDFPSSILLEDNACFGVLSVGRIKLIDNTKHYFRFMQSLMWDSGDLRKALVWAERDRARDLLFSLKSTECYRDSYLKQLLEFDTDYEKAWDEIQTICDMVGNDTVLLMMSLSRFQDGSLSATFSYLLHSGSQIVGHRLQQEDLNTLPSVYHLLQEIYTSGATEEMLQTYYNVLITPFSDSLERIQPKRIIFVPNEEYCMLPFAALMDSSRPERPYLIQRYAIVTSYSIRLLKQCLIREKELARQQLQECHPALLLQANDVPGQQYLEFAIREIGLVQDALEEAGYAINKLVNEKARKEVVLENLPQSSWVHVACHTTEHTQLSNGELVLSRGSLTGNEIQELGSPIEARAVILSACRTGVGRIFAEGVMALSRSFHVMGAPSVLVSLWRTDDEASCILMEKLYENLGKSMNICEALQNAMVSMLDEDDIFGTCAYRIKDWAAFVLSGSPYIRL